MSVPSAEAQATFTATLVDEWVRHGVSDAVICPGSRSTPVAIALARHPVVNVHVRLDERSAGFFALGRALVTKRPVVIAVTSGTAATELHAAVAEADAAGVPLIVVTSDRPPELHGVGAPQTVRQRELFGPLVRRFEEPGVARDDASGSWRPLASRLVRTAHGDRPGPVHLNIAFVEPLVNAPGTLPPAREEHAPWVTERTAVSPVELALPSGRVLAIVGAGAPDGFASLAASCGWPVLGDATTPHTTPHADVVLRADGAARALAPDVVIRAGGLPASKTLGQRLVEWRPRVIALADRGDVADPDGLVTEVVRLPRRATLRSDACADDAYVAQWRSASMVVEEVAATLDGPSTGVNEPSVARLVTRLSGELGVPLVVGSSMPVRDVEWWAPARTGVTLANRGVNGIDGVVSTTFGVAASERAIGLVGDVTYLHDVSAMVDGLGDAGGRCALVVADNHGGGIFNFLAQSTVLAEPEFTRLFATPRAHDLVEVARAFGHRAQRVETNGELDAAIRDALERDGVTVIVARVPHREDNVTLHDELNRLAADLLAERL